MTERGRRAAEHRDNRNTLAPDLPSTGNKKRNTRKFCKGKPGIEHDYELYTKRWQFGTWGYSMTYRKCIRCGKEVWRG